MRVAGVVCLLMGSCLSGLQYRRTVFTPIDIGRDLLRDLAILRHEICIARRPLPSLLDANLLCSDLWQEIRKGIRTSEGSLPQIWQTALGELPVPLALALSPIGPLLSEGGETLARSIDEARAAISDFLRQAESTARDRIRLGMALRFAAGGLLILVLL